MQPTDEELESYFREHRAEFAGNGQELTEAVAQQLARERVIAIRRRALLTDWIAGLRRRADISRPASH